MYKRVFFISAAFLIFLTFGCATDKVISQKRRLIQPGDLFPETPLQIPTNPGDRKYLGLPDGKSFALKEIKAKVVLVEILSVYCISCKKQMPFYNELFSLIEKDPETRGHIKIIGIAAGNREKETKAFREKYKVRFPIVPDPRSEMYRALGAGRIPFSIYVRNDTSNGVAVVKGTHFGMNRRYRQLFDELSALITMDPAAIQKESQNKEADAVTVKPILTEKELQAKVKATFATFNGKITHFRKVILNSSRKVYTALIEQSGLSRRLFAEAVSRPPTCDVCHDIHFIYVFDSSGKVLRFVPLLLGKDKNKLWDESDLAKMRQRILGRSLFEPFIFNPEVDAVSSATITSAIIFDSLSQAHTLYEELKEKGLI